MLTGNKPPEVVLSSAEDTGEQMLSFSCKVNIWMISFIYDMVQEKDYFWRIKIVQYSHGKATSMPAPVFYSWTRPGSGHPISKI